MNRLYPKGKEGFATGAINWTSDTIKITAVDLADYTFNTAHDFIDDVPVGARVATGTLAGKASTNGALTATSPLNIANVTGDQFEAFVVWKDTGAEGTSRLIGFVDGKTEVVCAETAASSATTLKVDPLKHAIASGASFTMGAVTVTLTGAAIVGARSLAVSALSGSIAAGVTGEAPISGSGLPFPPNGSGIDITFPGTGIFEL